MTTIAVTACHALDDYRQAILTAGGDPRTVDATMTVDAALRDVAGLLLTGGEDFEVLAAVPPHEEAAFVTAARAASVPVTRIGVLTQGREPVQVLLDGRDLALRQRAYVHGRGGGK